MLRKRTVVQSEAALNSLLTDIEVSEGDVLFRSQQYLQVGCDLRDLKKLEAILSTVINIHESKLSLMIRSSKGNSATNQDSGLPDERNSNGL